ncbi:MAG: hypothetical protein F6K19_27945 [Cyanothece sp. SIO1E1]|nr:hypothetical protein [Cyanothece sp. SIO1E1]
MPGQTSKVAIVNLDSMRYQSIMVEWEQALWEDAGWEVIGKRMVEALQQKYLRLQRIVQRSCMTPEAFDIIQAELDKDLNEIRKLDRKFKAAKKIFAVEIDNFIRQQFMVLFPKIKLQMGVTSLSTTTPVYKEVGMENKLVDVTSWFAKEFKSNPRIFENWSAFGRKLIARVEQGNWQ